MEHPYVAAILGEKAEAMPNSRPLPEAEIVVLSALAHAVDYGSKNLAQYGAPEVAGLVAAGAGLTSLVIEGAKFVQARQKKH